MGYCCLIIRNAYLMLLEHSIDVCHRVLWKCGDVRTMIIPMHDHIEVTISTIVLDWKKHYVPKNIKNNYILKPSIEKKQ